jgi:hypothetical protein
MPQTRPNKGVAPVNSDAYNLTPDLAALIDSLNVVIKVSSQAERDALPSSVKTAGCIVVRTDLYGAPLERYDGTVWATVVSHAEWTFASTGIPSATVWGMGTPTLDSASTTDTGITSSGAVDTITLTPPGLYAVTLTGNFGAATTGRGFMQIMDGATTLARGPIPVNEDTGEAILASYRITAAKTLKFACYVTLASGTTTWTGRVRITRIGH